MKNNKNKKETKAINLCIVSFPAETYKVTNIFLTSFVEIIDKICDSQYIISANFPTTVNLSQKSININMSNIYIKHPLLSLVLEPLRVLLIELKICHHLFRLKGKYNQVIFFMGGSTMLLSTSLAKLLGKKPVINVLGLASSIYKNISNKGISRFKCIAIMYFYKIVEKANFFLAYRIIVESKRSAEFLGLSKYNAKLLPFGARYIDIKTFCINNKIINRDNTIGYIGRLHSGKGILNFIEAVPRIVANRNDIRIVIGGEGPLYNQIKKDIDNRYNINLIDWIPHEELPSYLNQLKLLVLPSYSEGLPTIILEAMACGTIVLSTSVGGVPDIITDGETGFILKDNSPDCIAENIIRVLNDPRLEKITINARILIENEFSLEKAISRYKNILS